MGASNNHFVMAEPITIFIIAVSKSVAITSGIIPTLRLSIIDTPFIAMTMPRLLLLNHAINCAEKNTNTKSEASVAELELRHSNTSFAEPKRRVRNP